MSRFHMTSTSLVMLVLIASLSLFPVTASGQDATPSSGATAAEAVASTVLRIPYGDTFPLRADPQRIVWAYEIAIPYMVFEGLTQLDQDSAVVPAAAESWEFSGEDGTVLTFHLRDGLTYSNGTPLTAERFRYAIERTCDPRTEALSAPFLFAVVGCEAFSTSLDVATLAATPGATPAPDAMAAYELAKATLGVRAVDERTLEIQLTHPAAYFPAVAATFVLYPVKQEIVTQDPDTWWLDPANWVGNGPFRVAAIEQDRRFDFAANEHYWAGRPRLDGIAYVYGFKTDQDVLDAYRRGELEMAWPWLETMTEVEADPALAPELIRNPLAATTTLALNLNREPFQDTQVREAFAYAFDRAAYCEEIAHGSCVPTLSWIPPGLPGAIETDAYAFDPEKARQALAESSYGGPENLPEIVWPYVEEYPENLVVAEWLAEQFREVLGVDLVITPVTLGEYEAMYVGPGDQQLSWNGWVQDYADPQNWMSLAWPCGSSVYAESVGYCNPELDALLEQADREQDPAKRVALYEEAHRLLLADVPAIIAFNDATAVLVKPYVTGYTTTPRDFWPGSATLLTLDLEAVPASSAVGIPMT